MSFGSVVQKKTGGGRFTSPLASVHARRPPSPGIGLRQQQSFSNVMSHYYIRKSKSCSISLEITGDFLVSIGRSLQRYTATSAAWLFAAGNHRTPVTEKLGYISNFFHRMAVRVTLFLSCLTNLRLDKIKEYKKRVGTTLSVHQVKCSIFSAENVGLNVRNSLSKGRRYSIRKLNNTMKLKVINMRNEREG